MDSNPQEVTRMADSALTPADADAIGDAITWLILSEKEHPDSPGIGNTRARLEALLRSADRV